MDNKLAILIITLLTGCTSTTPSFAPAITVGSGAYESNQLNSSTAPVNDLSVQQSVLQPILTDSTNTLFDIENTEEEPMMLARSPFTVATVAPALYPVTRSNHVSADTQSSAGNPSTYSLQGKKYKVLPFSHGYAEKGIASWYGDDFHGKKTSNGEVYDMYGMTAAHKTLPIPSYVKVTNLKNNRSIIVRINDRGPYYEDRIIDLSYAAAQRLGVHRPGTEKVKVEAIKMTGTSDHIYLQLGVFDNPNNAQKLQEKVASNYLPQPQIKQIMHEGRVVYKVQIGPLFNHTQVENLNMKLASIGIHKTRYVTVK